jgi:hypothetical protein
MMQHDQSAANFQHLDILTNYEPSQSIFSGQGLQHQGSIATAPPRFGAMANSLHLAATPQVQAGATSQAAALLPSSSPAGQAAAQNRSVFAQQRQVGARELSNPVGQRGIEREGLVSSGQRARVQGGTQGKQVCRTQRDYGKKEGALVPSSFGFEMGQQHAS